MKVENNFSEKALEHISVWTWLAAILPITTVAAIMFFWMFGTQSLFNTFMAVIATGMFTAAAMWWWWIIWIIAKIMKKDQKVANDLKKAVQELTLIKSLVKETFSSKDK